MQQFVSCDESTLFSIIMEKENSCVWKVTTSGGIQFFTEPLLWEEGYLFLFNSCKIYHAKMSWSAFRWCKLILVYTSSFQIANPQKIHPPGKSCFNSLESPFLLGQRPTPKKKKKGFSWGDLLPNDRGCEALSSLWNIIVFRWLNRFNLAVWVGFGWWDDGWSKKVGLPNFP